MTRSLLILGALAVLVMAPAASAAVKTDFDHSANFENYRTFSWKSPVVSNSITQNSIVDARVRDAVTKQLNAKGLEEASANPDVYLTYHLNARNEREVAYLPWYGYGPGWHRWGWRGGYWGPGYWGPGVFPQTYVQGSLVVDMIDAHTNRLVWRAYASKTGDNLTDVQSEKAIQKDMKSAFKHYPPEEANRG